MPRVAGCGQRPRVSQNDNATKTRQAVTSTAAGVPHHRVNRATSVLAEARAPSAGAAGAGTRSGPAASVSSATGYRDALLTAVTLSSRLR